MSRTSDNKALRKALRKAGWVDTPRPRSPRTKGVWMRASWMRDIKHVLLYETHEGSHPTIKEVCRQCGESFRLERQFVRDPVTDFTPSYWVAYHDERIFIFPFTPQHKQVITYGELHSPGFYCPLDFGDYEVQDFANFFKTRRIKALPSS